MSEEENQISFKFVLIGDSAVGKTAMCKKFCENTFDDHQPQTVALEFGTRSIEIEGQRIKLQIWDTAGQERFQSLGPTFYRGTDCCILVYDVTKPQSFENIKKWRNEFSMQLGLSNADDFAFLLLGNKSDLPEKAVQQSAAREFAQMNGDMLFYEVSAKTADNVQTAFEAIVKRALEKAPKDDFQIPSSVVQLENKQDKKSGCSC